jgi:carboxymethylenebutenolidase
MDTYPQWIDIHGDDGKFGAYLAVPRSGKGPGILLIQEIFGVNAHIRSVADQYAADGFVVLAPDMFWRQQPRVELGYDEQDWARAAAFMQKADVAKAQQDIAATAHALRALPGVGPKIASVGYCWGGRMSYLAGANGHVDAAVAYYGGGIQNCLDRADDIKVPLLMHFGGKDSHIPMDAVRTVAERFGIREEVEIHVYPEAEHGFNCSHRSTYNQRAASEAHGHTLIFLSENT